jgi:putative addiction module antidote
MELKVRKYGNSLGAILPKEMAAVLNVKEGDTLFVTKTANGYEISPYDPEFDTKIQAARKGISKYRNALKQLAQ